jgi:hypothetical protein
MMTPKEEGLCATAAGPVPGGFTDIEVSGTLGAFQLDLMN